MLTSTHDAKGNLLTTTEQSINATTTFTYEPTFNQVTSIKDPRNNTTPIAYDATGNPLTITDAVSRPHGQRTLLRDSEAHFLLNPVSGPHGELHSPPR